MARKSNNRKGNKRGQLLLAAAGAVSAAITGSAMGANIYWDGTGTDWGSTSNWSTASGATTPDPSAVPGSADTAVFNITTVNTDQTVNLNANRTVNWLTVNNTGATTLLGGDGNRTLTVAGGLTTGANAGLLTIGSGTDGQKVDVVLSAGNSSIANAGRTVTFKNGFSIAGNSGTTNEFQHITSGTINFDGAVTDSAAGGKTKISAYAGTLKFNASNSYTGGLFLNNGATVNANSATGNAIPGNVTFSNTNWTYLTMGAANQFGSSSVVTFNNTSVVYFTLSGYNQTIAGLSGSPSGTIRFQNNAASNGTAVLTINNASDYTFTVTSGSLGFGDTTTKNIGITKQGNGVQVLAGSGIGYKGATRIESGTLGLQNTANFASAITFAGGTLRPYGQDLSSKFAAIDSNQAAKIDTNGTDATFGTAITGQGGLTKAGSGKLTLTANNTQAGVTTITGGTLALTGSGKLSGTSKILVGDSSTNSAATFDVSGVTGGFALAAGQILAGHGTIQGNVSTVSTSHLSPGNSIGTTTYANNLSIAAGTVLDFDFGTATGLASTSKSDLIAVTGALSLPTSAGSITLNVNDNATADSLGSIGKGVYKLFTYGSLTGGNTNFNSTFSIGTTPTNYDTGNKTYVFSNTGSGSGEVDLTISDKSSLAITTYTLAASSNKTRIMTGQSATVTATITNGGTLGANDALNFSTLNLSGSGYTGAGLPKSNASLGTGSSDSGNLTFTGSTTGLQTINATVASATNATLLGNATKTGDTSVGIAVLDNRTVTADTVHLGRQISGANLGSVTGNTTLSTTGDNNHYTAVTVKGHLFNTDGGTFATTATGTIASLAATGTLTTLTTTGEGLTGESAKNVVVSYDATALTKRTIAQSGTVNAGRLMSGSTKSFSGTATLSAGGGDSNTSTTLSVAGVTGAVDHAGLYSASVTGTLTGASGSLNSLSVTGEGLTGEGTYGNVAINYTADVFNPIELVASSSYNAFASGDNKVVVSGSKGNYVFTTATAATAGGTNQAFVNVQTPGDFTKPEYVLLALTGVSGLTNQTLAIDVASAINNSGLSGVHATYEGQDAATNKMLADWSGYSAYKGTDIGDFDVLVKFDSYSATNGVLAFDFSQIDGGAASVSAIGVVPEPTSLGLMALPALGLLARRRRSAKKA